MNTMAMRNSTCSSWSSQWKRDSYLGHKNGALRLMALVELEHVSKRKFADDITAGSSRIRPQQVCFLPIAKFVLAKHCFCFQQMLRYGWVAPVAGPWVPELAATMLVILRVSTARLLLPPV